MIDEWGIVVLFSLGAGSLQGWISSTYHAETGPYLGISFLLVAAVLKRRKDRKGG